MQDFRSLLKAELERRCGRNPHYSLRSFARDLGVSAGRLSEVLNGRSGISGARATAIAERLGWKGEEGSAFVAQVNAQHGRSGALREAARMKLGGARGFESLPVEQVLREDRLKMIGEWYHFAILELVEMATAERASKADTSPAAIARALGIGEMEAKLAVERLLRLGELEKRAGRLVTARRFSATTDGVPSETIRRYHRQLIEKSDAALDLQSLDERDVTSVVMAFDSSRMEEARQRIREFRVRFNEEFGSGARDSVYAVGIQFFKLGNKLARRPKKEKTR